MMEQHQYASGGSKRTLEDDEASYHSLSKRPSFSSHYSEVTVSDTETPSGSPRVNSALSNSFNSHHPNGSHSPRTNGRQSFSAPLQMQTPYYESDSKEHVHQQQQFPSNAILSLPQSILSLIPNSMLKTDPMNPQYHYKSENGYMGPQHHHLIQGQPPSYYPHPNDPHHLQQYPSIQQHYHQQRVQQQMNLHQQYQMSLHQQHQMQHQNGYPNSQIPQHFPPESIHYPAPSNSDSSHPNLAYAEQHEWGHQHSQSQMEYENQMMQTSLGYQSPFIAYTPEWQSSEIDIANADPENSNRFYLATQPNPIQRKCYKSEKRYLLPNPMIVKAKDGLKNVIEKGIIYVSVVDEKGDEIGKKQEELLSCNVGLSRNFSKGNTEIKYAIKLLENSGPIRFRLLFKVTYQTTFGSTVTETLYSNPFIVSHKTSSSSILLHTNAINSSASLSVPSSTSSPYQSGYSTPNPNLSSPMNLQFNRMTLNHQPHYNTPATSAASSRRSSTSSFRGT